jgi:hypothetical protein
VKSKKGIQKRNGITLPELRIILRVAISGLFNMLIKHYPPTGKP